MIRAVEFSGCSYELPIANYKSKLIDSIQTNKVTVIVGETGSGKSTQLPQYLCDNLIGLNKGCVVCTQPRRVAAVTIAKRVAAERNCVLGEEVGYSIRFDDCSGSNTKIKFATDGVLLREALTDRTLSRYKVVILDEAHERSLQTDILMGILKELLTIRNDLRYSSHFICIVALNNEVVFL
jgi:HrpA-like RNA helicase